MTRPFSLALTLRVLATCHLQYYEITVVIANKTLEMPAIVKDIKLGISFTITEKAQLCYIREHVQEYIECGQMSSIRAFGPVIASV